MFSFKNKSHFVWIIVFFCTVILSSCRTYYQKNLEFQEAFANGNFDRAEKFLDKNKKAAEGKNRLLYLMQKGVVLQMQGEYAASNENFEQAYFFIEDQRKNYALVGLSALTNPNVLPYMGEDHEKVLIHYYKALNFLMLNNSESALVEAKRLNNRLNLLNDRYENKKNRYQDDAFANIIMGLAYEQQNDWNNAFIAYQNAYNSYQEGYSQNFSTPAPEQLKQDLLRTAYLNGYAPDLKFYEKEFGVNYDYAGPPKNGEVVLFWHNGLGPVKAEWSVNFTAVKGQGGAVTFANEELGLNFPFPAGEATDSESGLGNLKIVRVAFPKYLQRPPYFISAKIEANGREFPLQKAENVNGIARSVLQDRFAREMGSSLLRLAAKQASEYAARQENEDFGAVIGLINAFTEKADTRNWQTLPHDIFYTRIPLEEGENELVLNAKTRNGETVEESRFQFIGENGVDYFHVFHSLASGPPQDLN